MEQMIAPNRLELVTKELANLDLGNFQIPTEIQKKDASYYIIIGIRSRDSRDGMSKVHEARLIHYNYSSWEKMQQMIKAKLFKSVANDQFNKVVILHNPTIKEPAKSKGGRPKSNKVD